jgi:hypothetical protein
MLRKRQCRIWAWEGEQRAWALRWRCTPATTATIPEDVKSGNASLRLQINNQFTQDNRVDLMLRSERGKLNFIYHSVPTFVID